MFTFFNGAIFHILFNAPQNINEYYYIWDSDLREFRLKGFGLERVCSSILAEMELWW